MQHRLNEVLAISRQILEQSKVQEWDEVEALQSKRASLTQTLQTIPVPVAQQDIDSCANVSFQIQTLNDEILLLSQTNKQNLYEDIKRNNKSKKMSTAYGK
ncbi:MAG: flagellar protein FliT [Oceanospirillaceae bacterium]